MTDGAGLCLSGTLALAPGVPPQCAGKMGRARDPKDPTGGDLC
jgi:hypothetical protein